MNFGTTENSEVTTKKREYRKVSSKTTTAKILRRERYVCIE